MDILKGIEWMKAICPEHRKDELGYISLLSLETDIRDVGYPRSPEAHVALVALTLIVETVKGRE